MTTKKPQSQPQPEQPIVEPIKIVIPPIEGWRGCDHGGGCPARAMVTVGVVFDGPEPIEVSYCSHHYNRREISLLTIGATITADSRSTLYRSEVPQPS